MAKLQSFELDLLRCELRRTDLVVMTPRRSLLLVTPQNPGVQTIQSKLDTL